MKLRMAVLATFFSLAMIVAAAKPAYAVVPGVAQHQCDIRGYDGFVACPNINFNMWANQTLTVKLDRASYGYPVTFMAKDVATNQNFGQFSLQPGQQAVIYRNATGRDQMIKIWADSESYTYTQRINITLTVP